MYATRSKKNWSQQNMLQFTQTINEEFKQEQYELLSEHLQLYVHKDTIKKEENNWNLYPS